MRRGNTWVPLFLAFVIFFLTTYFKAFCWGHGLGATPEGALLQAPGLAQPFPPGCGGSRQRKVAVALCSQLLQAGT